jgi:tartrate-resistant acid phosphatase type 5
MNRKTIRWIPVVGLGYLVAATMGMTMMGCAPKVSPAVSHTPTETPSQVPSATLFVTPTMKASVTPSPIPSPTHSFLDDVLPVGDIAYKIPLTIRHLTQDSVNLFFEIGEPASGSVYIRSMEGARRVIEKSLSPSQTRHLLVIGELNPGTRYEVFVVLQSDGEDQRQPSYLSRAWGPVTFRTVSESDPVRFGVIGDASFGDLATVALVEEMATYDLDFVLHTGDVVDETEEGMDPFVSYAHKYFEPFEALLKQMPIYTVIGNHDYDLDIRWQGEPFYFYAFPPFTDSRFPGHGESGRNQYYAFAYQGVQFVMLDTQIFFGMPGREEQDIWLEERLADPNYIATIPVFHVSPYSSSTVHPTNSLPVRNSWVQLFESANVPLVISGHFHHYERLYENGITFIVSGGGSSILYALGERLPGSQIAFRQTHFVLVEIEGNTLKLSAIALGGDLLDQVEIPLN